VSIEDVCLLQRPRWQGGLACSRSEQKGLHDSLAVMGRLHLSGANSCSDIPSVRVVKRGAAEGRGLDAGVDTWLTGEKVVFKLREREVVLIRPQRGGASNVPGGAGGDSDGPHDDEDDSDEEVESFGEAEDGNVGVWEWSEGGDGELVFITNSGKKVSLPLTDQAPLPLDSSIMGEVSENMVLLWHKTVLMQQMGDNSGTAKW
jgi:hypothetical protein